MYNTKKQFFKYKFITKQIHFIPKFSVILKANEMGFLKENHFESFRKIISKKLKKIVFLKINKTKAFHMTKKTKNARMGKGKGIFTNWIFKINLNQIIFAFSFYNNKTLSIFIKAKKKLPIKTNLLFKTFFLSQS